ncbi:MAG: hypothetical protein ACOC96_05690 [Actinomycetota bacterium]
MAEPFIFVNTYTIKPGKADGYWKKFRQVADLVQAKEPRMLYFGGHANEDGSTATTVQVHADADNMLFHLELVGEHIRQAAEDLDFSTMSVQIYGSPTEAVMEHIRELAGFGIRVSVNPAVTAFHRFTESE